MRRSIVYFIVGFILLSIVALVLVTFGADDDVQRFHQHLERPSEADLGDCLDCGEGVLCTHLPLIIIDTFGAEIPGRPLAFGTGIYNDPDTLFNFHTTADGETEIEVAVSVIDNHNSWNHSNDTPTLESMAMMRLRGNSSRFFDKPNYRISLIDSYAENNPLPLLGIDPHHEWSLHGPFLDKTLMRNYMWMNIGAEVMGSGYFVPEVRFFELILNGEYQGVYVLMETIRVSPYRVSLNRHREGMPATSYLIRLDSNFQTPERNINTFSYYTYRLEMRRNMEIMYPRLVYQNETVQDYVARSISITERFLYSNEVVWDSRRYEEYIDVDSFVNFFIINEFVGNNDLWSNSTFFYKDIRSNRIVAGPLWDYNNVMDNFFLPMPADQFYLANRGWHDRLMMCPHFTDRVIRRWNHLRGRILAEERLIDYMQDVEDWLGSSVDRNFEVWGYSFDYTQVGRMAQRRPATEAIYDMIYIFEEMSQDAIAAAFRETRHELMSELNPSSFEEAMNQSRDFMIERGRFLDNYIEALRQYSHPSRHALWILE